MLGRGRLNSIPAVLTGAAVLDFEEVGPTAFNDLNITVAGAMVGDPVSLATPHHSDAIVFTAHVSGVNNVCVRAHNYSDTPIDPASGTFRVLVFKF